MGARTSVDAKDTPIFDRLIDGETHEAIAGTLGIGRAGSTCTGRRLHSQIRRNQAAVTGRRTSPRRPAAAGSSSYAIRRGLITA